MNADPARFPTRLHYFDLQYGAGSRSADDDRVCEVAEAAEQRAQLREQAVTECRRLSIRNECQLGLVQVRDDGAVALYWGQGRRAEDVRRYVVVAPAKKLGWLVIYANSRETPARSALAAYEAREFES